MSVPPRGARKAPLEKKKAHVAVRLEMAASLPLLLLDTRFSKCLAVHRD